MINHYMKNKNILILLLILAIGTTQKISAQVNASATASATILSGINITKVQDMHFGRLNPGAYGGTAVLSNSGVVAPSGDVTKLAGVTPSAASFTESGETGYTISITLPSSDYIISDGPSHDMTLNTNLSNPPITGTISGGGTTFSVGAKLTVIAGLDFRNLYQWDWFYSNC